MDAAPVHLASNVLRACAERSVHVIVVPAQMTWLLQPLDTHAFRLYKATCMRAFQTARTRADTGHLTVAAFLQVVYCTIREVLQGRTWHHAFAACGYTMGQTHVSESVLSELGLAQRPEVSSAFLMENNCSTSFLGTAPSLHGSSLIKHQVSCQIHLYHRLWSHHQHGHAFEPCKKCFTR